MKIDIKSIFILILLGFSIFFFSMWFLKGTGYKKEYKKLEKEFEKVQKSRDSLNLLNIRLKSDFVEIGKKIRERDSLIKIVEAELKKKKEELKSSKDEVSIWKNQHSQTKKKIEELKKNPIKREDDELIKSLKEKLK
jgi:chromosome segregation ATPase